MATLLPTTSYHSSPQASCNPSSAPSSLACSIVHPVGTLFYTVRNQDSPPLLSMGPRSERKGPQTVRYTEEEQEDTVAHAKRVWGGVHSRGSQGRAHGANGLCQGLWVALGWWGPPVCAFGG